MAFVVSFTENVTTDLRTHPNRDSYVWKITTQQRSLIINSSDPNYVSKGEYRIQVEPTDANVVYEISYSS